MKLQSQVCSLEQSKRLKEFGIIQESLSVWTTWIGSQKIELWAIHDADLFKEEIIAAAFNVAELGAMLPNELDLSHGNYFFTKQGQWHSYESVQGIVLKEWQGTEKEGIRRAEILIDLLELRYTTPEEVNNRLLNS